MRTSLWRKDIDICECFAVYIYMTWFRLKIKWWCPEMLFWIQKIVWWAFRSSSSDSSRFMSASSVNLTKTLVDRGKGQNMFFYIAHIITDEFHISICNVHGDMNRSWRKWIHGCCYTLIPTTEWLVHMPTFVLMLNELYL